MTRGAKLGGDAVEPSTLMDMIRSGEVEETEASMKLAREELQQIDLESDSRPSQNSTNSSRKGTPAGHRNPKTQATKFRG
jgi:hypothetical protein